MLGMAWGVGGANDNDALEELTAAFFGDCLKAIREEKAAGKPNPNRFNARKAIEYWVNRGRPPGEGVIEDLLPPKSKMETPSGIEPE